MALNDEGLIEVPGVLSRWVRLANGAKAHYITAGETGPPVILLHGGIVGSSGMAGWRFMLPALAAAGFRAYAPDRPGFGFADTREEYHPRSWLDYVDFVEDFANALCIDQFYIGGNSNGTQNAIYYMLARPQRVIAAALVATAGISTFAGAPSSQVVRRESSGPARQFDGSKESMYALLDPIIWRKEGLTDELLEMRTRAANIQLQSNSGRAAFASQQTDPNLEQWLNVGQRLPKLTIPTIYLHGVQDVSAPVENAYVAEPLLPNVQFFYPDPCGHQGQTDQPDLFNSVFVEFFRDGRVSRETADKAAISRNRPEIPSLVDQAASAIAR